MTPPKSLRIVLFAAIFGLAGSDVSSTLTSIDSFSLISRAEARVGRPLTPVSVAGVARRTARRCAAGVYNC